jgi:hypothetical protein
MIKLKNLLPEISLMSGNAGSDTMEDFYGRIYRNNILPAKYDIVRDWMGNNPFGLSDDEMSDEAKKEREQAKKLMLVNKDFITDVDKKLKLITKNGGYELRLQKEGKNLTFHLVDPKAKYIYEYFIGIIQTESGTRGYRLNPKKAFNLNCYQIHWSNVAAEHMGKGLGKLMYTMVYEYVNGLGAALVSDSMLFEGSQKMWFDFIPSIASFFGVVVGDVFFPIDKGEVKRDIMGNAVDTVVAMENPPTEIRKIANNVKGLSFKAGEYGMMRVRQSINDKIALKSDGSRNTYTFNDADDRWDVKPNKKFQYTLFSNLVDECPTMLILLKRMEQLDMADRYELVNGTSEATDLKACVFSFSNANVIVKETGGRLVMVAV